MHHYLLAYLFLFTLGASAQEVTRRQLNLNANWEYLARPLTDIAELASATVWQAVSLPHTWNQWDAVDNAAGYRRDASWYRKTLPVADYGAARYLLYFEGANIRTQVYVNGRRAGEHVGGYVGFRIDVTELVEPGRTTRSPSASTTATTPT